jgi:hypothetical protein
MISKQHLTLDSITSNDEDMKLDRLAIDAMANADAVIYVCSIETVPSTDHRSELLLCKHFNAQIVGVINKRRQQARILGEPAADARANLWREMIAAEGVSGIFEFDAHWDRYDKLGDLFAFIATMLSEDKRGVFETSLVAFRNELDSKRMSASKLAAGCIRACSAITETADSEQHGHDIEATRAAVSDRVRNATVRFVTEFTNDVSKLYSLGISTDGHNLHIEESDFKKASDRIGTMAGHSGVAIGIASFLGGLIGLMAGGPVGAFVGVKVGAGIGAGLGLFTGAITETNTRIEMHLSADDVRETALFCLAIMWCLTHQGFGNDPKVNIAAFRDALTAVQSHVSAISHPDWNNSNESTMSSWFDEQMRVLAI